jgi:hypothetical protein
MMWLGYACLLAGGALGAAITAKALSGYVNGMPKS